MMRDANSKYSEQCFTIIFTVYTAQEPADVERYRVIGITANKIIMSPRLKETPEVNDKENNGKQGISLYFCSKDQKEDELGNR